MEQHVFMFYKNKLIEGTSKKVFQILMPLEPIYNKKICFDEQKCLLRTLP